MSASNFDCSELWAIIEDLEGMEYDAFLHWYLQREEVNLAFMIEALNILGKPYELWVFRTDCRDGVVFYGAVSPDFEYYCDIATITLGEAINELMRLRAVGNEPKLTSVPI